MHFLHCGCKVNQYETNAMIQKFIEQNYEIVDFEEYADIYVVNTCTVTNMADRKSRQILRRVKEINPNSVLAVCGCYAQAYREELEKIEDIDIIIGTNQKNNIVHDVEEYIKNKENIIDISDVMTGRDFAEFGNITYTEKTRAVIKVQDGCDNFCSYCIIPYARGRVRSRKIENVIEEVKNIAKKGIQEVVVTGIHVASYGKDFEEKIGLIDLLEEINKIEGIYRIRLGSLEPTLITEEFLARLTKLEKICRHFHLSLQSACDNTLKRMNRKYQIEQFKDIVDLLRKNYGEDVCLTTDIIVGFPGETEEDFEECYKNLEKIKFYKMHVFKYSIRKGTRAAVMPNQITNAVKEQRSRRLIDLSNKNEEEYNQKYIGRKIEVLFEESKNGYMRGHTENYIVVNVKTEENLENKIKTVTITGMDNLELFGEIEK